MNEEDIREVTDAQREDAALPDANGGKRPDAQTLRDMLEPLRGAYPRADAEALTQTEAFRAFGEARGWDAGTMRADLPGWLEQARALMRAAEPPVSRATLGGASRGRRLLSAHQERELEEWNRANPRYAMTELEYFRAL